MIAAVPLTRTHRDAATHVEVEPGPSGLRETSYAKCEEIRSISPLRLRRRFGAVEGAVLTHVELILRRLLAL